NGSRTRGCYYPGQSCGENLAVTPGTSYCQSNYANSGETTEIKREKTKAPHTPPKSNKVYIKGSKRLSQHRILFRLRTNSAFARIQVMTKASVLIFVPLLAS